MNDGLLGILRLAFVALQNLSFAVVVGVLLGDRWLWRVSPLREATEVIRSMRACSVCPFGWTGYICSPSAHGWDLCWSRHMLLRRVFSTLRAASMSTVRRISSPCRMPQRLRWSFF